MNFQFCESVEGTWVRRVFLFIAGERFAGSVGGSDGILGFASFLPQPVQAPGAYFLSDDNLPQGLLSPGKDEDGRRDGTRLKAPSQVLTRATRTTSVLHALNRRLRDSALRSLFLALVLLCPTFRTVSAGVPQDVVYLVRFRKDVLARRRLELRVRLRISLSFPRFEAQWRIGLDTNPQNC